MTGEIAEAAIDLSVPAGQWPSRAADHIVVRHRDGNRCGNDGAEDDEAVGPVGEAVAPASMGAPIVHYVVQPSPSSPHDARRQERGARAARQAIALGVAGVVLFGVVLGPLALVRASQARAHGVRANVGEIWGWIAVYAGLLQLAFWLGQWAS